MPRVKICGICSAEGMLAAAEADWVGFVFVPRSPRVVTPAQAEALSGLVRGGPLRVGLFVDPSEEQIEEVLEAVPLDVLQLYTDAARAAEIREIFGVAVWRAIAVTGPEDLPWPGEAIDGYVLDAAAPEGSAIPGGNGVGFDHATLRGWQAKLPWLLAGGLTAETVAGAIAASGAAAVDVSSGVERARGVKDAALISTFIQRARAA